jgi:hypothetical protein
MAPAAGGQFQHASEPVHCCVPRGPGARIAETRPGADQDDRTHRRACRQGAPQAQETLSAIDTAVRPNAFAARSTRPRPARPSQGSTAAPTAACSSPPRGPSGSARTPRSSPPSSAPVRSSRPARDRHWPPPSTRADRRPVHLRTLRQHREARIMSGHSRSATAHPGYSPTRSPGSGKQQPRRVTPQAGHQLNTPLATWTQHCGARA